MYLLRIFFPLFLGYQTKPFSLGASMASASKIIPLHFTLQLVFLRIFGHHSFIIFTAPMDLGRTARRHVEDINLLSLIHGSCQRRSIHARRRWLENMRLCVWLENQHILFSSVSLWASSCWMCAFKLLISGAFSIMLVIFAMSWNRTFYVRQFGAIDSEGQ